MVLSVLRHAKIYTVYFSSDDRKLTMADKRFATLSSNEIDDLDQAKDSDSTKRTIKRSVSLFQQFIGEENDIELMSKSELNGHLRSFFASVRTVSGEELKKASLLSLKFGLSRHLHDTMEIDIKNDPEFASSLTTFKSKLTDLKKKGKGGTDHKEEIAGDDLKKLFDPGNIAFNSTPCGLQNKVWFNLMFHLCRRGRENLRQMTKQTFAVSTDSSGRQFVHQIIDEADKNHGADSKPDDTIGEARMYETPGMSDCPVKTFQFYLSKLHPDLDALWQRPLEKYTDEDDIWYYCSPLGRNKLSTKMADISKLACLSRHYTNHCIRATSISALDRAGFEARHIMRASGHKSESSIRSYSRRLSEETQRSMSATLSKTLVASATTGVQTQNRKVFFRPNFQRTLLIKYLAMKVYFLRLKHMMKIRNKVNCLLLKVNSLVVTTLTKA